MGNSTIEKKIVLCRMSPAHILMPSPALSVLKSFLCNYGFIVDIEYWNVKFMHLQWEFVWNTYNILEDRILALLLYLNYLAITKNDEKAYLKVRLCLKILRPQFINISTSFYDDHMHLYAKKMDDFMNEIISKYNFEKILFWGFELNLDQWICSSIIAEKVKKNHPESKIVIGGIDNKKNAIEYLKNFTQFDYAIWGEGEYPLLQLSKIISDSAKVNLSKVANMAYRVDTNIVVSNNSNKNYLDLSFLSSHIDYMDYFNFLEKYKIPINNVIIPLEGSRGCHWKKCHFCYLNTGYRHRLKNVTAIIDEIEHNISYYKIYKFQFLDNDIIGNDFERFEQLLEKLIEIKNKYAEFSIEGAEIITKGINSSIIKKMSIAGFNNIQIGYESLSDSLLRKIDKKNSVSSNLLFLKFAQRYDIKINGMNIIKGLLEETDDDIAECIENLHFVRFLFNNIFFKHKIVPLIVNSSSHYFKDMKNDIKQWEPIPYLDLLPEKYISSDSLISIFGYYQISYNKTWDRFTQLENYYRQQKYVYSVINLLDYVLYREYCNGEKINELEFTKQSVDWKILIEINNEVLSIDSLYQKLKPNYSETSKMEIISIINELTSEGLVYHNTDYSENVSLINVSD
jgi:radical SAM superfamily enzyme YgiQ (UPF0313 family)